MKYKVGDKVLVQVRNSYKLDNYTYELGHVESFPAYSTVSYSVPGGASILIRTPTQLRYELEDYIVPLPDESTPDQIQAIISIMSHA